MSTTPQKKEIIDFLWEWAENNNEWGKLLINLIVGTENALSQNDRNTVFDYFLHSIGLKTDLSIIKTAKPTYSPNINKIELMSLSDVVGVNKLAAKQTITFNDNLTVVFGENGTGKTGYGRILKALGYSYDTNSVIHPNIYNTSPTKSALIKYKSNGTENIFQWNGENSNADLTNISVFNSSCVQISLSDKRELIVSPIGFYLFNIVTTELTNLSNILNTLIQEHQPKLLWTTNLNSGSPQEIYIKNLSAKSDVQKLLDLSAFTALHEQELNTIEQEIKNLNKTLLETEIKNLNLQISELDSVIIKIQASQKVLNSEAIQKINVLNQNINKLKNNVQKGLNEIANANGIEYYQSPEFQVFIKSAEEYIKLLNTETYPNTNDDICIYCRRLLDVNSKELLTNYRRLLNDTTQEELKKITSEKTLIEKQISLIEISLKLHSPIFGIDTNKQPIQPQEILDYNDKIASIKISILSSGFQNNLTFEFDYNIYLNFFNNTKSSLQNLLSDKVKTFDNIEAKEKDLSNKINELKDRKLLSSKVDEIKIAIENQKIILILEKNKNGFSTNSISRKTSEARNELIKNDFNQIFFDELKLLRKSEIKIEIDFETSKGKSKIQQKLNNSYFLSEILSEGEQKAIALAEFLTELRLDKANSPVIFDDPVNSLDHNIIDDVARRLIKLSFDRQIVIFTHSVLFFNSLMYISKQSVYKDLKSKFYNVKSEFGETGLINDSEEEINKVTSYLSKINVLINNTSKGQSESDIASDGYGYLRAAIELCVEHEIFQGTVKRYQKNIALTSFVKIDGNLLNQHKNKLNEIFERCCGFIKGHSNPLEIYNSPSLADLNTDLNEFKSIRKLFEK